jgi:Na+/H+ antiporter NhaD/arsenite permease-like protein
MLKVVAEWLNQTVASPAMIATLLGMFSAIVDNVPLVAATMGMYSLEVFPMDSSFWHMIAYAAGTGGSLLIIGSSAGVAIMGIEKIDFLSYAKKMSIPVGIGYLAGMGAYLIL